MTEAEQTERSCSKAFVLARLVFGSVLAFTAIDNFRDLDESIEYAKNKNVPQPERTVPFGSGALLFGSLGIAVWRAPRLATVSVLTFLVPTTLIMHDFWNEDGDRETQKIHFLKNLGLIGGALAFFAYAENERR